MTDLTLLQVSDIHVASPSGTSGDGRVPRLMSQTSLLDGLAGHEYRSLVLIRRLHRRLVRRQPYRLVVTGDLTAAGRSSEHLNGSSYLFNRWQLGAQGVGLHASRARTYLIPGNHDHWPGNGFSIGPPRPEFDTTYGAFPAVPSAIRLSDGWSVRFILVDSDSDVSPVSADRLFARGRFSSQLVTAEEQLDPEKGREIRVLLLHHSPRVPGYVMSISRACRKALDEFIVRNGIDVVLSGHTHTALVEPVVASNDAGQRYAYLSATCGTSAQLSRWPYDWSEPLRGRRRGRHVSNSVLLHTVLILGAHALWSTETLVQSAQGFVPSSRETHSISVEASAQQ